MSIISPLNTEKIWLEKIDIRLAQTYDERQPEDYRVDVKVDVMKREDAWAFRIRLSLDLTPAPARTCRYERISISTMGQFDLPSDAREEFVRQVVPLNCLAILHGFSRGIVAQVTGLNDGGPVLLPAINFIEVLKSKGRKTRPARRGHEVDQPRNLAKSVTVE